MNKNKELQRQQEDAAFAHGLWWVGCAILVELVLLMINNFYFNFTTDVQSINNAYTAFYAMNALFVVAPIVAIIAAVKAFLSFKKTGKISGVVEGALGLGTFLSLAMSLCMVYDVAGCGAAIIFIPVAGAVAFSFFLYPRDFFYSAAIAAMGGLVLWMTWQQSSGNAWVSMVGTLKVVVFSALICWIATLLKKSGGTLTILGYEIRFLAPDAEYMVIFISAAIAAVATVVGLLIGGYFAYYLIYLLAAWAFALVVYYTVRML